MAKQKYHSGLCQQWRKKLVRSSTLNLNTGQMSDLSAGEWRVEHCGVPLFGDEGPCRSCRQGWNHEHNYAVRIEVHEGPDKQGRYRYTYFWMAEYHPGHPEGEHGWRERAQEFHAALPEWARS